MGILSLLRDSINRKRRKWLQVPGGNRNTRSQEKILSVCPFRYWGEKNSASSWEKRHAMPWRNPYWERQAVYFRKRRKSFRFTKPGFWFLFRVRHRRRWTSGKTGSERCCSLCHGMEKGSLSLCRSWLGLPFIPKLTPWKIWWLSPNPVWKWIIRSHRR